MCGDPADIDFIISSEYSGADLDRRDSEAPIRADGVGGGVYEHGISVSALLTLVEDWKSLVGGIGLRV